MKVIKPQCVSILTRPFEMQRQMRLGVSLLLFVPLLGKRALLPEASLWRVAAEEMEDALVLDTGIPKARCEYLVAGTAYPVLTESRVQCTVRASVAGQAKALLVTGDRYWLNGQISAPQPLESMRLEWARAFGGPGYPPNPYGRGLVLEDVEGEAALRLPNVERIEDRVQSLSSRPTPGGFRALDVTNPERARKAGTHDGRWLREGFPGVAPDIDWSFFNVAPSDQQLEGDAFPLDASYEFTNMHPTLGVVAGRLPNVRARCFVSRAGRAPEALEEVPLRLGTLWFFPHRERAVLVFQGAMEVEEDDGSDITHLVGVAEDVEAESLPTSHFAEALKRRLDPEKGYIAAMDDSELRPSELAASDPVGSSQSDVQAAGERLLFEQRQAKRRDRAIADARAEVAAHGLDPDIHGPVQHPEQPAPTLEEVPAYLETLLADMDRLERDQRDLAERRHRENEALFATLGLDYGQIRAEVAHEPGGPPSFSVKAKTADLRKMMVAFAEQGLPTQHIQEILADPVQQESWRFAEQSGIEAYRLSAHLQRPAPAQTAEASGRARALLLERQREGAAGADFTGVDLSGLDLAGVDLTGAFLESARLSGSSLRGAKLGGAVLAHADLRGADLEGADLRGANLGSAQLGDANLSQTQLEGAILAAAHLERARFDDARLANTDLSAARFEATRLARVNAAETTFMDCAMRGVDFGGARLERCNFLQFDLSEARFCEADLSGAVLLACSAVAADFTRARLVNLRAVEGTVFDRACLRGADLSSANLRECSLQGARLELARLEGADLSRANLEGVDLYRAVALGARFGRANLTRARLVGANLMDASFASARLDGADLTGAHLFGADLSRVRVDAATRFEAGALVHARIHPVRAGGASPLPDPGAG